MKQRIHLQFLAPVLCLLGLVHGAAQASVATYTNQADYLAALGGSGTDHFDDLLPGAALTGPISRTAGSDSYRARVQDTGGFGTANGGEDFFPVTLGGGAALSANFAQNILVFDQFSAQVRGVGGLFFAADIDGNFLAGALNFSLADGSGITNFVLTPGTAPKFLGFISDGQISSLSVVANQSNGLKWATVDDLVLSVPEPDQAALTLLGLAMAACLSRRRKAAT